MHKENIRCTYCGTSETREINLEEILQCSSCDEAIFLKQAVTFGKRSDQEGAELSKLRDNLQRVILAEDDSSVLKYSQDILTFIPNDYSALYYEAYVKNKQGQPKALNDFYESTNDEKTTKELENVVKHILTHFVLTHYNKANAFMKRESPQTCDELNRLYKERIQKEEDYAVVPRQVFICHKSEDFDVVRKVSDAIEKDGNKCWYSERNLRPNDGQNYWKNIEDAIDNATIFLVISSDISMRSEDVQRELQYANKKNKKKIEYKIDDSVHTLLFKHSFDGIKWIDGKNSKELEVLKERVFELLNEKEPVKEEPKAENKSKLNIKKNKNNSIGFIIDSSFNIDKSFALENDVYEVCLSDDKGHIIKFLDDFIRLRDKLVIDDFLEAFKTQLKIFDHVIVLTVSNVLSQVYNKAMIAKNNFEFGSKISVFDTESIGGGGIYFLEQLIALTKKDSEVFELLNRAEEIRNSGSYYITSNEYRFRPLMLQEFPLKLIKRVKYKIARFLKLNPILELKSSNLGFIKNVKGVSGLIKFIEDKITYLIYQDKENFDVYINFTDDESPIREIKKQLTYFGKDITIRIIGTKNPSPIFASIGLIGIYIVDKKNDLDQL